MLPPQEKLAINLYCTRYKGNSFVSCAIQIYC